MAKGGEGRSSLNALKEFGVPETPTDWSRLLLGLVFAGFMLMAGRVWGESLWQDVADRALQNESQLEGMRRRFDDHVEVEASRHEEILSQLREIRIMLQGGGETR